MPTTSNTFDRLKSKCGVFKMFYILYTPTIHYLHLFKETNMYESLTTCNHFCSLKALSIFFFLNMHCKSKPECNQLLEKSCIYSNYRFG